MKLKLKPPTITSKYLFAVLLILTIGGAFVSAQTVIGPYEIYVSEQKPINPVLAQQAAMGSADEGRVINIKVTDVQGPITVSPTEYDLNGPPCPTYTPNGQRIPANPIPANTTNFQGSVMLNNAQIPAAGTTTQASFKVKDYGYWTVCSLQEKKYFPDEYLVKYNINSIQLVLSATSISCCKGDPIHIDVKSIYPAGAGTVSWTSSSSNISVSGDNGGADITGADFDEGIVTATLTVGQAVYLVNINVKVGELKFNVSIEDVLWYAKGSLDAKTLLTPNSIKDNLKWTISANPKAAVIDENTGVITYPDEGGAVYTVKVESKTDPKCKAELVLRIVSMYVSYDMNKTSVCDGAPAFFKLNTYPDVGASLIQGMQFTMHGDPKDPPKGNPGGTTTLDFSNMATPSMTFSVKHSWWYSTGGDDCNDVAYYNIYVTTTVNGNEAKSEPKLLGVSTDYTDCLYGRTFIDTGFTGLPFFHLHKLPNSKFGCTLTPGDFRRKLEITIVINTDPSSQFKQMVTDEENYHKNQFLGNNGITIINDLFDTANIMGPLRTQVFEGNTRVLASQAAMNAFMAAVKAESARSRTQFAARRCDIEKQAKDAINATYRGKLKCAYPNCP